MKIMIASDLHGSAYYGEKLLSRYQMENCEKLVLLGDLLYHGPRNDYPDGYETKSLFAMLNEAKHEILAVRGNCDSEVDQMVLEFPIMASYAYLYADGHAMMITHGHQFHIDALPPLCKGDTLIYGHYHVPLCEERDGILCLNPGSVSLPKDGTPHSYMIYEDHTFTWKDIDGTAFLAHTLAF